MNEAQKRIWRIVSYFIFAINAIATIVIFWRFA